MGLALVVIEEHARGAMHLRNDDALGAVDHERAVHGHERHVAHVDVLLLDVADGLGAGVRIHVEHDQTELHLQRSSERHAALAALIDVILRLLKLIGDEIKLGGSRKIPDREHRLEDRLQTLVQPAALGLVDHQELVVRGLLHLDQIGHFRDFADMPEEFADTLAAGERLL